MLIKGAEELKFCERPEIVLEMIIMRVCYASSLPDLADIVKQIMAGNDGKVAKNSSNISLSSKVENNATSDNLLSEAMKMFPGAKVEK